MPTYQLRCSICPPGVKPQDVKLSREELEQVKKGKNVLVFCGSCGGHIFQVVPAPFSFRMMG